MNEWTLGEVSAMTEDERAHAWRIMQARARQAARAGLAEYGEYVFGLKPAAWHELLIEGLEALERGELRRLLSIAPPGHAKSTWTSIIWPSWYLGRHPRQSIVGVTLTDTLARLYADAIANVLEWSEEHRSVFADSRPDKGRGWSKEARFLQVVGERRDPTSKDPQLAYLGAGAGIVGRRADGAVIDDVVDLPIVRSSDVLLPQRVSWIQSSVLSRLQPGAWAVCVGTLWGEGDVVDTLRRSGEWATIVTKAESPTPTVHALVDLPDGVGWRPSGWEGRVEDDSERD